MGVYVARARAGSTGRVCHSFGRKEHGVFPNRPGATIPVLSNAATLSQGE